jgi:hypothetical protein
MEMSNETAREHFTQLKIEVTINKLIEKLQEYRRSLITAAVTGKLDISEVETDV